VTNISLTAGNTISEKSQRKLALFLLGELAAGSWRRGASKAQDGSPQGGMKGKESESAP